MMHAVRPELTKGLDKGVEHAFPFIRSVETRRTDQLPSRAPGDTASTALRTYEYVLTSDFFQPSLPSSQRCYDRRRRQYAAECCLDHFQESRHNAPATTEDIKDVSPSGRSVFMVVTRNALFLACLQPRLLQRAIVSGAYKHIKLASQERRRLPGKRGGGRSNIHVLLLLFWLPFPHCCATCLSGGYH
eukprot:1148090-Pelagomonas_calceolata.AAC.1